MSKAEGDIRTHTVGPGAGVEKGAGESTEGRNESGGAAFRSVESGGGEARRATFVCEVWHGLEWQDQMQELESVLGSRRRGGTKAMTGQMIRVTVVVFEAVWVCGSNGKGERSYVSEPRQRVVGELVTVVITQETGDGSTKWIDERRDDSTSVIGEAAIVTSRLGHGEDCEWQSEGGGEEQSNKSLVVVTS
ncbi:hypothetical protein BC629DRAFT_1446661 [Irpex lacteus]|nr:hypothetical protein BC629DRAFT_1446661 [Irpex lacteus]